MKRELLEYLLLPPRAIELKLHDDFVGTYYETQVIETISWGATTVIINHEPYAIHDIMGARLVCTEDNRIAEIEKAPALEYAILFIDEEITPLVEIALNAKKQKAAEDVGAAMMDEVRSAATSAGLPLERVLRFIAINYSVDTQSDVMGIYAHYKQAIEKLKALPFGKEKR